MHRPRGRWRGLLLALLLLAWRLSAGAAAADAWQWSWWIQTPLDYLAARLPSGDAAAAAATTTTLTREEIRLMRARDIKRALARVHGYSAEEVARMIDKADLIEALTAEEAKRQGRARETAFRHRVVRALLTALLGAALLLCWPLLTQGSEIVYINLVVWSDRKRYEVSKCRERKSVVALVGVILMLVLDLLQFWLTASLALSWIVRRNRYFFPLPPLNVQPGQLLGQEVAGSRVGGMSVNVAPMLLTWLLRFLQGRLEDWTGRALARALRAQRQAARDRETPEERAARKTAKRLAREQERQRAAPPSSSWMEHVGPSMAHDAGGFGDAAPRAGAAFPAPVSAAHDDFLKELDDAGGMGELD